MTDESEQPVKLSKGKRTAARILDVAEELFATQGYDGTSLRQIADAVGIKEPGLYNHFANKQSLYEAVLHRALNPMTEALSRQLEGATGLRDYTDLPSIMTDLLAGHPQMAALFQQALQDDTDSTGSRLVHKWLDTLFSQGMESMERMGPSNGQDRATLAISVIALFNLTTGYFLAQRAFETIAEGDLKSPENLAKQKQLLHKVIRAMLIS